MTHAQQTPTARRPEKTDGGYEHASFSTAIVLEIADRTDRDVTELPPLYDAINPEALDRLVESANGRTVSITFEYAGHRVDVTDRSFELRPLEEER